MATKKKFHYVMVITNNGPVFVTQIEGKFAHWVREDEPLELPANYCDDLALGLCANGSIAMHVVLGFKLDKGNHIIDYTHGEFVWKSKKTKKATKKEA